MQLMLSELPGYAPQGAKNVKPELTLEVFDRLFRNFVLTNYHRRIHSTIKTTPLEKWAEGSFLPQLPQSLEKLDLLLLTVAKSRKVRRDGIHFQTFRYMNTTLAAYVGESVMIRYDPRDLAEIRVFFQDKFLCRAICQELAGETISLKEIIKARKRRKKELREIIQSRKKLLQQYLPSLDVPTDTLPERKTSNLNPPIENPIAPKKKLKLYWND